METSLELTLIYLNDKESLPLGMEVLEPKSGLLPVATHAVDKKTGTAKFQFWSRVDTV